MYNINTSSFLHVTAGDINPITLTIVCTPNMLAAHISAAIVTVVYTVVSQCHHPAITQHIVTLPLSPLCRPVAPAKKAEYKVRDHVMLNGSLHYYYVSSYHRYQYSSNQFVYSILGEQISCCVSIKLMWWWCNACSLPARQCTSVMKMSVHMHSEGFKKGCTLPSQ